MSTREVIVPDLMGLTYQEARKLGVGLGLLVLGVAPDGQPVNEDSEGLVIEQTPLSGETRQPGRTLTLRIGRPPSGVREPADPVPPVMHESDVLQPPPRFTTKADDAMAGEGEGEPVPV